MSPLKRNTYTDRLFQGNFGRISRNHNVLKLHANVEKQICLSIRRILTKNQQDLGIKACSGIRAATGSNVENGDSQPLETVR